MFSYVQKDYEGPKAEVEQCVTCGFCRDICPTYAVTRLESGSPRGRMQMARAFQNGDLAPSEYFALRMFECTSCGFCSTNCPRGLKPLDVFIAMRSKIVEDGRYVPAPLVRLMNNMYNRGNEYGEPQNKRREVFEDLDVKRNATNGSLLYFVGCATSFDSRARLVARSFVRILKGAGIDIIVLGEEEFCSGNEAKRMGEDGLFRHLAERNIESFRKHGVRRVVTTSPHPYNSMKNDYGELGMDLDVQHHTQFLYELIKSGRLKLSKKLDMTVTFHDPCFLGRHNGEYDAARKVIASIPGVERVEMDRSKERSLCCGGGGGGIWLESEKRDKKSRMSEVRFKEAADLEPDALITACPLCLINFESASKTVNAEKPIQIMDIVELVEAAI